jgi:hypothetical protein
MSSHVDPVRDVTVITTGDGEVHHEHIYGTRKPELVWIFFGRRWLRLPIHVYVIDHAEGLVLFDTGQDRAVLTDPDYWPDPITALFYRHIFRDIRIRCCSSATSATTNSCWRPTSSPRCATTPSSCAPPTRRSADSRSTPPTCSSWPPTTPTHHGS